MIKLLPFLLFFYLLAPTTLLSDEIKSGGNFFFIGLDTNGQVVRYPLNIKSYNKNGSLLFINQTNNWYNFIIEYDKKSLHKIRQYLSSVQKNGIQPNHSVTIPVRVSTLHKKSVVDTEFSCFVNDNVDLKVGCIFFRPHNKQEFYITSLETLMMVIMAMGA